MSPGSRRRPHSSPSRAAILVAVLRHRLLDIDRIVSRTIGWASRSRVLAAIFVSVAAAPGRAGTADPGRIARGRGVDAPRRGVLQPVRARLQRVVDRRFDRAAYDRDRRAREFGGRLRDELDLATIERIVEGTSRGRSSRTAPRVWLRPRADVDDRADPRRRRHRRRAERPGRGDHAGPGRSLGPGLRGAPTIGGGTRTQELTLPGFRHDVCSTIVPLTVASPFFRTIDWAAHGVELVQPDAPLAHALDAGPRRRPGAVGGGDRGRPRRRARRARLAAPVRAAQPRRRASCRGSCCGRSSTCRGTRWPSRGSGCRPCAPRPGLARVALPRRRPRALFAGLAAHSMLPLDAPLSASFGLVLGTYAHAVGWPMVRGGSAAIADALAAEIRALGGEIVVGHRVASLADLPASRVVIADTTPQALAAIAGDRLPARTRGRYAAFRYGPGVFKVDWALDGPIPWTADGLAPRGDRPPRRDAGRASRRSEAAVAAGRRQRPAVHAARPVRPVGPEPRARRARRPPGRTATCPTARTST